MELFGKKKPLRGIIEPPKAISPAFLGPLLNGHLISVYHPEPLERLHIHHFFGYDPKNPAEQMFSPKKVTIEFALPEGAHTFFERYYEHAVEIAKRESEVDSVHRYMLKKEYDREEAPMQWQFDKKDKKEKEKMEKLKTFGVEALNLLKRTYPETGKTPTGLKIRYFFTGEEKKEFEPELAKKIRWMFGLPLLVKAAGYNVRVGDYDTIKKLRAEDAAKGIATPHRITVHLPLTQEEAIRTYDMLSQEHSVGCPKCSAFYKQSGGERYLDPSCPDRLKASYFGLSETERVELRKKMREAELKAMKAAGIRTSANAAEKAKA